MLSNKNEFLRHKLIPTFIQKLATLKEFVGHLPNYSNQLGLIDKEIVDKKHNVIKLFNWIYFSN